MSARVHVRMCMHERFHNGLLLAIALMSFAIWCRRQCSGHVGRGVQVRRVRWRCSSVVRLFAERVREREVIPYIFGRQAVVTRLGIFQQKTVVALQISFVNA